MASSRPAEGGRSRGWARVGAATVTCVALALPNSTRHSPAWAFAGVGSLAAGLVVARAARGASAARELAGALAFLLAVACWRQADGGGRSGLGPLVLIPVLWLAARGHRRSMWAGVVVATLVLVVPVVAVGPPSYPGYTLRSSAVMAGACAIAGWLVERLVSQLRAGAARSRADSRNLAEVQRLAGLGSWTSDRSTGEVWWSDEMYRLLGFEPGAFVPQRDSFARSVVDADRERFMRHAQSVAPGVELRDTCRVLGGDGAERSLLVRGWLTIDDAGVGRTHGTVLDVTRVVELEGELSSTTQKLSRLLDSATGQAIVGVDARRRVTLFSAGAEALSGYAASEVLGCSLDVLWPPDVATGAHGGGESGDRWLRHRDGSVRVVHVTDAPLRRGDGTGDGSLKIAVDVTEARRAAEALVTSEALFRVAFDEAPCGMALLPAAGQPGAGRFTKVNQALCDLTGAGEEQLLSSGCLTYILAEDHHVVLDAVAAFVDGVASSGQFDCRVRRPGGEVRVAQVRYANIFDGDGRAVHCVVQFDDVTARREARRSLEAALEFQEEAADRLRELDRVRADFVSMVSHELRTPLTSISGYVEMLLDGDGGALPATALDMLAVVERNSGRLLHLIEDLLTLSRIDSDAIAPVLAPAGVGRIVEGALEAVWAQAERGGIAVEVDVAPAVAATVLDVDAGQIERALINVVANAVKFTPSGGTVSVRATAAEGAVEVVVADTGIGIGEEELGRIFDRFFRTSESVKREIQGSGLGLPITKSILEAHGGTIEASSRPGEGTTMRVRLPASRLPAGVR